MPTPPPDAAPVTRRPRLPRLAALLLGLLIILAVTLPLAARQIIGPTRLKALTEQALTDALGRQVTVSGGVSITLSPWLGLAMGPVTVANAPGFGDEPMLTAGRLEMTIRMLPLLVKVVSPGSVRVNDLVVHLTRSDDGRTNWDDLTAPQDSAAGSGWTVAPQPRDIRLENIAARVTDATTGRTLAVTGARLRTGLGQPFAFSASFTAAGVLPDTSLECHLQGQASFDATTGRLGLHRTKVESGLVTTTPLVPGGATPARLVSRFFLDYDPAGAVLTLTDIDSRAPGLRLTGRATVADLPGTPKLQTELALTADMAGNWLDILGLVRPDAPESLVAPPDAGNLRPAKLPETASLRPAPSAPGQAEAAIKITADAAGCTLERLDLRLPEGTVQATARTTFGDAPTVVAAVTAADIPFASLPRPVESGGWPVPGPWLFKPTFDVQAALHHCSLGGLVIADAAASLRGGGGLVRLYPASAALPGGSVVSLDARLTAAGGLDGGPACDLTAAVESAGTMARFSGRLDATGAAGTVSLTSPDPGAAAKALGLTSPTLPPGLPTQAKGQITWLPASPGRWAVTGLEAKVAETVLRGQLGYGTLLPAGLSFDLAVDSLDFDHLPPTPAASGPGTASAPVPQARGRLRLDHVAGRGLEARNAVLELTLDHGHLAAVIDAAELFGGKLTGTVERQSAGRVTAALQLTGAEAGKLFAKTGLSLAGPVAAKATLEAGGAATGRLGNVAASLEAESSQLFLTRNGQRQPVAAPKAILTLKGLDGADGFDGDATLTLATAGADGGVATLGLRDIRLNLAAPVSLDRAGRLKDTLQGKLDASALIRPSGTTRDIRLSLTGPVSADPAGGFSAGDLACNLGGALATAKIWRKAGDAAPTQFNLDCANLQPRQVLPAWGVALPADTPAGKLAKASLTASGTADDKTIAIQKLAASLDDTHVTGHGVIDRYEPTRGKWELSVDSLDLDAYAPQKPAVAPPAATAAVERRKPLDL